MGMYTTKDIDDYLGRLTDLQKSVLVEHVNEFNVKPEICAWYDDKEDYYVDWIEDNKIYTTREEAEERYQEGLSEGEFLEFDDGQIIRLVR